MSEGAHLSLEKDVNYIQCHFSNPYNKSIGHEQDKYCQLHFLLKDEIGFLSSWKIMTHRVTSPSG